MKEITLVLGGSGGLGREVCKFFPDASNWSLDTGVGLTNEVNIASAVRQLVAVDSVVRRLINCAGVNALSPFDEMDFSEFEYLMEVNAYALVSVVQELRANNRLPKGAAICNVISNAANLPMTHSLAYNASKAAQEIITRQMARELKDYCIFGVSPNKLAGTGMSRTIEERVLKLRGWTKEEAQKYQLAALPAGQETPAASVAAFIAELMKPIHHPFITSCIFPYGGPT